MEQPIKKKKFSYFARSRLRLRPQEIWERDYHEDVVRRNEKLTTLGNWQCLFMYSPLFQLHVPFFLLLYAALLKLHFIEQQKKEKITVRAWQSNFQYQNSVIIKSNLF